MSTISTISRIALQNEDGSITSVYCHYDGYPSDKFIVINYIKRELKTKGFNNNVNEIKNSFTE
jgi:hypothetical protein